MLERLEPNRNTAMACAHGFGNNTKVVSAPSSIRIATVANANADVPSVSVRNKKI